MSTIKSQLVVIIIIILIINNNRQKSNQVANTNRNKLTNTNSIILSKFTSSASFVIIFAPKSILRNLRFYWTWATFTYFTLRNLLWFGLFIGFGFFLLYKICARFKSFCRDLCLVFCANFDFFLTDDEQRWLMTNHTSPDVNGWVLASPTNWWQAIS